MCTRLTVIMTMGLVCGFLMTCSGSDEDPEYECGNSLREPGELCDGLDLGGISCGSMGLGSGEVICNDQCHFVLSGCSQAPECGNGVREATEACDGSDLGSLDCGDLGYDGGELTCRADCDFDLASCCGDGCPADGDSQCVGDVVQTCSAQADGCLGWGDTTDCSQNAPAQDCEESGGAGACVDRCQDLCPVDGDEQCATDTIETCLLTSTGCLDWTPTFDCDANVPAQTCDATAGDAFCITPCQGDCTATDGMRCNGTNLEACEETTPGCYQWSFVVDCTDFICSICFQDTWDTDNAYCGANC
jgi:hypothetical protein